MAANTTLALWRQAWAEACRKIESLWHKELTLKQIKKLAAGPPGRRAANILLLTAFEEGVAEWYVTAEGPSFGFDPVEQDFQRQWDRQIRSEQEPIQPYEPPRDMDLSPEQLARAKKCHYECEQRRRAGDEAGRRKEREFLEQMRTDFESFWPDVQARYWLMSSRDFADRLSFRPNTCRRERNIKLLIHGKPADCVLNFRPGRIDLKFTTI